jgi:hypothetical protein
MSTKIEYKLRTETCNDIILRYLEKVLLVVCIELYQLNILRISLLHWKKWENVDRIILDINFALPKFDTIILEIDNGHVYNLVHPWARLKRDKHSSLSSLEAKKVL